MAGKGLLTVSMSPRRRSRLGNLCFHSHKAAESAAENVDIKEKLKLSPSFLLLPEATLLTFIPFASYCLLPLFPRFTSYPHYPPPFNNQHPPSLEKACISTFIQEGKYFLIRIAYSLCIRRSERSCFPASPA